MFFFLKRNPVIEGWDLIFCTKDSNIRFKIAGERGHPCLVPLDMANGLDSKLSVYTWTEGVEYNARMADRNIPWKPNLWRTFDIYLKWTQSNAFSTSMKSSREGIWLHSAKCTTLRTHLVASDVCLSETNPVWSGCINKGKTFCSLCAKIFAYSLTSAFSRESGRKFAGQSGFFPGLGMVTTWALNLSGGNFVRRIIGLSKGWGGRSRWGNIH